MSVAQADRLSIGVSTMHGRGVLSQFAARHYFIIDQGIKPVERVGASDYVFLTSRGLSISRNVAVERCGTEFLLFSDDDVVHLSGVPERIIEEFDKTNADIVTFTAQTPDGEFFKQYAGQGFRHTMRSVFRVSSIEIAVRVSAVRRAGLKFDEEFGLGAKYPTGEEIVFLADALRAGLIVRFCPFPIVVHPKESSGARLYRNDSLIRAKGAMFGRVFPFFGWTLSMAFAVKHYQASGYSFAKFMRLILDGYFQFVFRNLWPK